MNIRICYICSISDLFILFRHCSTAINFLITRGNFSAFHTLTLSRELWLHHQVNKCISKYLIDVVKHWMVESLSHFRVERRVERFLPWKSIRLCWPSCETVVALVGIGIDLPGAGAVSKMPLAWIVKSGPFSRSWFDWVSRRIHSRLEVNWMAWQARSFDSWQNIMQTSSSFVSPTLFRLTTDLAESMPPWYVKTWSPLDM